MADPADHIAFAAPAALYRGKVMHARMKPRAHRFTYRVMNLLLDIDALDRVGAMTPLLRVNRRGVFSFYERDHGGRDGKLRTWLDAKLRQEGAAPADRVLLLCYPRLFGYAFNPLSVYYCYSHGGALQTIVYEVRNTFGGMQHYVRPVVAGEVSKAGVRQQQRKLFYVSPFIEMDMHYHFRMSPPCEDVKVRILETDAQGPLLSATFSGRREALSSAALAKTLVALPFMTLKIIAAIHYEALRLWLKGIRLVPRPAAAPRPDERAAPAVIHDIIS